MPLLSESPLSRKLKKAQKPFKRDPHRPWLPDLNSDKNDAKSLIINKLSTNYQQSTDNPFVHKQKENSNLFTNKRDNNLQTIHEQSTKYPQITHLQTTYKSPTKLTSIKIKPPTNYPQNWKQNYLQIIPILPTKYPQK